MILVDANLLVYAYVESFSEHAAARRWLDDRLNGTQRLGLPWPSLLAFVRLVSNPRVFEHPASVSDAWVQAQAWLDCPPSWVPPPTEQHRQILSSLIAGASLGANQVPDAHLATLAIEHGLVLHSTDRDFARFPGLNWQNPLDEA